MGATKEHREILQRLRGATAYSAGVSGTVVIPAGGRVTMWSVGAGGVAATVTVNNGDLITIPAGESFTAEPKGELVAPTFIFTGTSAYYVEYYL